MLLSSDISRDSTLNTFNIKGISTGSLNLEKDGICRSQFMICFKQNSLDKNLRFMHNEFFGHRLYDSENIDEIDESLSYTPQ